MKHKAAVIVRMQLVIFMSLLGGAYSPDRARLVTNRTIPARTKLPSFPGKLVNGEPRVSWIGRTLWVGPDLSPKQIWRVSIRSCENWPPITWGDGRRSPACNLHCS